jgi:PAS domain S-box-containing protein
MRIHFKALLIFFLAVVLLFGAVTLLTSTIILDQFSDVERGEMVQETARFNADLYRQLIPILATAGDWATWDDLCQFVEGKNPDFIADNLADYALENLHLDFLTIWDAEGNLIHGNILNADPAGQLYTAIRDGHVADLPQPDGQRSGFLLVGNRIVLVAVRPILASDRSGPVRGSVVAGRFLDSLLLEQIQRSVGVAAGVTPLGGNVVPPGLREIHAELLNENRIIIRPLSTDAISGYLLLWDINGNPIAICDLTAPRTLYAQGRGSMRIFLVGLALTGGILFFVIWFLLDRAILSRIRKLDALVSSATAAGRFPQRLELEGDDELSALARRIEELARSVQEAESGYRAVVEDQTEFILRYRPDGSIKFVNEAYCRYIGQSRETILDTNITATVAADERQQLLSSVASLSPESPVAVGEFQVDLPGGSARYHFRTDRAIFDESGRHTETLCVSRDVTERHHAELKLKSSEARYRRLFETSTDGILLIDGATGVISDVNPRLSTLLSLPKSHFINRPFRSVEPFATLEAQRFTLEEIERRGTVRYKELELGNERTLYVEFTGISYNADENLIIQINLRDITDRKHADEELRLLSGRLLKLQDDERRRIARELHDSTAQNLAGLEMCITQLEALAPADRPEIREVLVDTRELATLCSREIRTISYLLHPPLLDEVGLAFAVEWYVDGFMNRTGIVVHLDLPNNHERLPAEIETTLFRIVQEALSNIHRHSGSKRAWIRLHQREDVVQLEVRDQGAGIPPSRLAGLDKHATFGVGLAGMRERLRQLNGRLQIESNSGGTLIRATILLRNLNHNTVSHPLDSSS